MQSGAIRPIPNMLPRKLFTPDHEAFRETVRKFYEKEVVPNIEKYETAARRSRFMEQSWCARFVMHNDA